MLPNFILHSVLLVGWHIYSKDRLLPFDRRFGHDVSTALVLPVLIIIARYKLRPIFFSSVRLLCSALFHSSRCEAVFGYGVKFRESTGIMSNLSINVIIWRCFDILIHCSFIHFTIFQLKIVKHDFFYCTMVDRLNFLNYIQHHSRISYLHCRTS